MKKGFVKLELVKSSPNDISWKISTNLEGLSKNEILTLLQALNHAQVNVWESLNKSETVDITNPN